MFRPKVSVRSRSAPPLLVLWLATVHTALMLVGPCLHELPGGSHDDGMGAAACERHPADHAPATHRSADDCQVCQFLSQGQLPTEMAGESSTELVTPLGPLALTVSRPRCCLSLAQPRAPPWPAVA